MVSKKIRSLIPENLKRGEVWGETDAAVHWAGAFAVYGGHGATASSTIVYEIEPGKRLGWHTDATEETQYIIAGQGKLYLEDGSTWPVGPGQRVRAADADAPRSGKHRQGDASRRRILRCGDVHPGLRPGDAAAEKSYPRHAKPRGLTRRLCGLAVEELAQLVLCFLQPASVGN